MDLTALSILNNDAVTLYNGLDNIEKSSRSFFDEYFNELEAFMSKNKPVIIKIREIRKNYFNLINKLSKEHPEAHKIYTDFLNAQASGNTKLQQSLGDKIDALMEKSDTIND
jgi:hypothetical protein